MKMRLRSIVEFRILSFFSQNKRTAYADNHHCSRQSDDGAGVGVDTGSGTSAGAPLGRMRAQRASVLTLHMSRGLPWSVAEG
jgi:hypothetical protein